MKNTQNDKIVTMFKHGNTSAKILPVTDSFNMTRGGRLDELDMAYETWGKINADKSNVIVIFTGLSADSHVTSTSSDKTPGWWESMVGKDKAVNTSDYFIV